MELQLGGQNTHPKLYYKSQLLPKIFRYLFSISIFCLLEGFLSHSLSILLGIKFSSEKLYCMAAYLQGRGIARVGKRFVSQISYSGTPNPSLSSSFLLRYLINYWYYIYIYSIILLWWWCCDCCCFFLLPLCKSLSDKTIFGVSDPEG